MNSMLVYAGLFLGIFLEGELVFLSAVIAAHHGYLDIWLVILIAVIGTLSSDLFYFTLGRRRASGWIQKSKWKSKMDTIYTKLDKHEVKFLLSYRFLYGMRMATPLVLGTHTITYRKFMIYSVLSTVIWATVITLLGLFFGQLILTYLSEIEKAEHYIIGGLIALAAVFLILRLLKRHKAGKGGYTSSPERKFPEKK